jgi:hypothetical protein
MGERTGSRVFQYLWSYVAVFVAEWFISRVEEERCEEQSMAASEQVTAKYMPGGLSLYRRGQLS